MRTPIIPHHTERLPLLTIQLDQGSPGMAGAAFLMFHLGLMIYMEFDKIHRLTRDIKNSENWCCQKIYARAKLWYAYIVSINKRPHGKGAFATEKKRWMEVL